MTRKESLSSETGSQGTLFTEGTYQGRSNAPKEGLIVTNNLNLDYMLASGMIMPPDGFKSKYYRDTLEAYNGWIPVFAANVFSDALKLATSEEGHLKPCIAKVRLNSLAGRAYVLRNRLEEIRFPDDCRRGDQAYLLPAPFPVHWIECILYASEADRKACTISAEEMGNVPLQPFKRRADRRIFGNALNLQWPPSQMIPSIETHTAFGQTTGGIAAMLFHLANRGSAGVDACRLAFDPDDQDAVLPDIPVLAPLRSWLMCGETSDPAGQSSLSQQGTVEVQQRIFWDSVDALIAWRSSNSRESAEDVLLAHLRQASRGLRGVLQKKLTGLVQALKSLAGFGNLGPSELFRRFPSPFSRAMTLFLLRRSFAEVLEFENSQLNEADMLAAAILFAAREGWERLPLDLRDADGLQDAVCHRMAAASHRLAGTGSSLGEAPPRCRPLREVFSSGDKWRKADRDAAVLLARKSGWDCVNTVIRLGNGDYRFQVGPDGVQFVVKGEPKSVLTDIDRKCFFARMARARVSRLVESEVRAMIRE